jgi:hypothetical protein
MRTHHARRIAAVLQTALVLALCCAGGYAAAQSGANRLPFTVAQAVYKCSEGGRTVYSDVACVGQAGAPGPKDADPAGGRAASAPRCRALDEQIRALDARLREPNPVTRAESLTRERKRRHDERAGLGCQSAAE